MNSKTWIKKGLTVCLNVAILATYSMIALAAQGNSVGDLTITGKSDVTVNGEVAQNGRTIFSSSLVKTSDTSSATLNLGKLGKIEVAPNTTFNLKVDNNIVAGDLVEGKITSLASDVTVTVNGKATKINVGESAVSGNAKGGDDQRDSNGNCVDTDKDGKLECDDATAGGWWIWTLVFGGAVAGILFATLRNNNRVALGGGTTVVSPTR
jgi:hypothetical protein